mgnify:CR=1 FL=1
MSDRESSKRALGMRISVAHARRKIVGLVLFARKIRDEVVDQSGPSELSRCRRHERQKLPRGKRLEW